MKPYQAQLAAAEDALREIVALGRTDGPAAPLLVKAGDIAEAALRGSGTPALAGPVRAPR